METAFVVFGLGVLDAIITQILKDAQQQSKVIWLRVSMGATVILIVAPELFQFLDTLRRWVP